MSISFKQDISNFPFDELYRSMSAASKRVESELNSTALRHHKSSVEARITAMYSGREDSYEGDREADFPFIPPDAEYVKEAQAAARKEALQTFCASQGFHKKAWVLPQLAAYIAKLPLSYTVEGKVDSMAYLNTFMTDDFHKGIWALCTHPLRGDLVVKQFTPENRNYCALVPLLLMPHKRFNNIAYSSWDTKGLNAIVDSNLYKAMTYPHIIDLDKEEALSIRNTGLEVRSGKNIGTIRNPQTTHKLYSMPPEFKDVPWLTQVMFFQIWCAHPINRTDLMILDHTSWDNTPEALETTAIFSTERKNSTTTSDLPW